MFPRWQLATLLAILLGTAAARNRERLILGIRLYSDPGSQFDRLVDTLDVALDRAATATFDGTEFLAGVFTGAIYPLICSAITFLLNSIIVRFCLPCSLFCIAKLTPRLLVYILCRIQLCTRDPS